MRRTSLIVILLLTTGCSSGGSGGAGNALASAASAVANTLLLRPTPKVGGQAQNAASVEQKKARIAEIRAANQARVAGTSPF